MFITINEHFFNTKLEEGAFHKLPTSPTPLTQNKHKLNHIFIFITIYISNPSNIYIINHSHITTNTLDFQYRLKRYQTKTYSKFLETNFFSSICMCIFWPKYLVSEKKKKKKKKREERRCQ